MKLNKSIKNNYSIFIMLFFLITLFTFYSSKVTAEQENISPAKRIIRIGLVEAVLSSIQNHYQLAFQQQEIEKSLADLQIKQGQYDYNVSASMGHNHQYQPAVFAAGNYHKHLTDNTSISFGTSKKIRFGTTFSSSVSMYRNLTDYTPNLDNNEGVENTGQITFNVKHPLLRGSGNNTQAALEKTAALYVQNQKMTLNHTKQQKSLDTIRAYWYYLAAIEKLDILEFSEKRSKKYLRQIKSLIRGGELPRQAKKQIAASLANKGRIRIQAEQNVYNTLYQLQYEMGLKPDLIKVKLIPKNMFPEPDLPKGSVMKYLNWYTEKAFRNRIDIQYINNNMQVSKELLSAAENESLPQLDLNVTGSYLTGNSGNDFQYYLTSLTTMPPGYSAMVSVSLDLPLKNRTKLGEIKMQQAQYRKDFIQLKNQKREIAYSVLQSLIQIENAIVMVKKAHEVISNYKAVVKNEKTKLKAGLSTVLELILNEDTLTDSMLSMVESKRSYADAIATLYYETGQLIITKQTDSELFTRVLLPSNSSSEYDLK